MKEITGHERSIYTLLSEKYSVDSYQREYNWQEKQTRELMDDFLEAFSQHYKNGHERSNVEKYGQYFLGPIIVSETDNKNYIVDGQQRLTTLTLILICLLHLIDSDNQKSDLQKLVYSEKFGKKSFNLKVSERAECLQRLYNGESFDADGATESIRNLVSRYEELLRKLEEDLSKEQIPLFADWFVHKVILVKITTYSSADAYKIFETMNDRGLRLTPAEMLKGYLLSEIQDSESREKVNAVWKEQIDTLADRKGEDADAIKAWLRAQKAKKLSDFEDIGTQFHRWVRDNSDALTLKSSHDFMEFIVRDFAFYAQTFLRLRRAAEKVASEPGLECVHYLAQHSFTLQYPLLLASLSPSDNKLVIKRKLRVVATYLDILIHRRIGNWKWIAESAMRNKIFALIPEIRDKDAKEIADLLVTKLEQDEQGPTLAPNFGLHKQNRPRIKRILARITDYVETQSINESNYATYFASGKTAFEIEHIWHADYRKVCKEEKMEEDLRENDFETMRNNIGGLLLLPKKDNASYGAKPYAKKCEYYLTQNLLAGSLHDKCYEAQTGLRKFKDNSGLPFEGYTQFQKKALESRQTLYCKIADKLWHPDRIHKAANE